MAPSDVRARTWPSSVGPSPAWPTLLRVCCTQAARNTRLLLDMAHQALFFSTAPTVACQALSSPKQALSLHLLLSQAHAPRCSPDRLRLRGPYGNNANQPDLPVRETQRSSGHTSHNPQPRSNDPPTGYNHILNGSESACPIPQLACSL